MILKYAGAAYLIYLAATIAMSEPSSRGRTQAAVRAFWGAVLFPVGES